MKLRQIAEPVEFDAFHWALHLRGTGRSAARGAVGLEPLAIRLRYSDQIRDGLHVVLRRFVRVLVPGGGVDLGLARRRGAGERSP